MPVTRSAAKKAAARAEAAIAEAAEAVRSEAARVEAEKAEAANVKKEKGRAGQAQKAKKDQSEEMADSDAVPSTSGTATVKSGADSDVDVESVDDDDAEVPTSSGGKGQKKRFEVKKWNAVALWAWDIVVDNCAICRNHIMDLCIECQANQASATSEECTVAWGVCNVWPLNAKAICTAVSPSGKNMIESKKGEAVQTWITFPENSGKEIAIV